MPTARAATNADKHLDASRAPKSTNQRGRAERHDRGRSRGSRSGTAAMRHRRRKVNNARSGSNARLVSRPLTKRSADYAAGCAARCGRVSAAEEGYTVFSKCRAEFFRNDRGSCRLLCAGVPGAGLDAEVPNTLSAVEAGKCLTTRHFSAAARQTRSSGLPQMDGHLGVRYLRRSVAAETLEHACWAWHG